MLKVENLPKNHVAFCDMLYNCVDISEHDGMTLLQIIEAETGKMLPDITCVENWLRGLPSACTIPFYDDEIELILNSCGNASWSIDDYWRFAASRVLQFAKYPYAYK